MIEYECPECGEPMRSPSCMAGEEETCPLCDTQVIVPEESVCNDATDDELFEDDEELFEDDDESRPRRRFVSEEAIQNAWAYLEANPFTEEEDADSINGEILPDDSNSFWCSVRRYIGGTFAYWVYVLILFGGIRNGALVTILGHDAKEQVEKGVIDSIYDYSWGSHYIWFAILFCVSVFCTAALTGAIAKRRGAIIAFIANIPLAVFMGWISYLHYSNELVFEAVLAWKIVLPLSLIGSIVFSIYGGIVGENVQKNNFEGNTVFGIHTLHWIWLWLPSSIYITCISASLIRLARVLITNWGTSDETIIPYLLLLAPIIAFGYPVYMMYRILSGNVMSKESVVLKIPAFIGVYICGLALGLGAEWLCITIFLF